MGLKHSLAKDKIKSLEILAVDVDCALYNNNDKEQNENIRSKCRSIINKELNRIKRDEYRKKEKTLKHVKELTKKRKPYCF